MLINVKNTATIYNQLCFNNLSSKQNILQIVTSMNFVTLLYIFAYNLLQFQQINLQTAIVTAGMQRSSFHDSVLAGSPGICLRIVSPKNLNTLTS